MLARKVRRGFFQERDVLGLLGDLRPKAYQLLTVAVDAVDGVIVDADGVDVAKALSA
ncbi:hypothetical protein [Mycolicibacterium sarraceniae]|uniref:hypothetical protein n=1 Tax=Mycolicibacterium sarraceniae TaxID=1534348 RepID=UPI0013D52A25|nr:hypothetical protein [Mycolicibacterium sarraceniae]